MKHILRSDPTTSQENSFQFPWNCVALFFIGTSCTQFTSVVIVTPFGLEINRFVHIQY